MADRPGWRVSDADRRFVCHVVPTQEEHNTLGLDCWCCPVYYDPESPDDAPPIAREEAERRLALDEDVLCVHRSEIPGMNDATGPIPWQTDAR